MLVFWIIARIILLFQYWVIDLRNLKRIAMIFWYKVMWLFPASIQDLVKTFTQQLGIMPDRTWMFKFSLLSEMSLLKSCQLFSYYVNPFCIKVVVKTVFCTAVSFHLHSVSTFSVQLLYFPLSSVSRPFKPSTSIKCTRARIHL